MKTIKKILDNPVVRFLVGLVKVVVWVCVILIVLLIALQRLFNNQVSLGSYRMFTVVTGSMLPEYKIYDVIIVKEEDPKDIEVGDDVAYLGEKDDYKDKIITHRVIKKREDNGAYYFTTQGIANQVADPEICADQLYGTVSYRPKVLSWFSHILNNSYGLYFLIIVPIAFLILLEILDYINRKESELEEDGKEE